MKIAEIRDLSTIELNEKLKDLKGELFNLRFQLAVNQLDNPMRLKAVKKDIARIKTVLREQELKAE
ncbi:MAG TPA: 50S ribosomal protein L29 [Candidatus Egerieicola faecale]|uniref:Large ribosomal subunit protein uL29 n=1 Tax=Candidatus Egerieicola faecale TaxID=2840774 RepID=A0A9D1LIN5_9FIRM|nr:50S ribosomal protein L29 [Candidatus Egerieicola faecale]